MAVVAAAKKNEKEKTIPVAYHDRYKIKQKKEKQRSSPAHSPWKPRT